MSWGSELWDKSSELHNHTQNGIDFVEHSVAGYLKDRGKIEAEYAKSLRGLVKKYSPKEAKSEGNKETFTHVKAFKEMLSEVGFQAGQHEVLYESLAKEEYKNMMENTKALKELRKKNIKESEKIWSELKHFYKNMEAAKEKFRKAYEEQEKASAIYNKANDDGSVTKNEVGKLQIQATKTSQVCELAKGKYASQLVKTNEFQAKYYRELLPQVLVELQQLDKDRIEIMRQAILHCVKKEKEVLPIISKCHDSIESAINSINPDFDTEMVIERFKSGDVPPGDFNFEDMHDPAAMLAPDSQIERPGTNLNLYQKKRELERNIDEAEKKLGTKKKELKSLKQMVNTYKNNPKFGNPKHFQGDIQNLTRDISELEVALRAMKADHMATEDQLESIRSRSPMVGSVSPMIINRNRTHRSSQSSGSLKSSTLSIGSSSHTAPPMNTSPDSLYERVADDGQDNWDDEFEQPPPPPPQMLYENGGLVQCVALYDYPAQGESLQESNIAMTAGQEMQVVNNDSDGWTLVRRLGPTTEEGYVPTSYLKILN